MAGCDPPSIRTVLDVLHERPRLTGAQLRAASGLPRRTIYQALRVLCDRGTVLRRTSLQDSRQTYYWLNQELPRDVKPASRRAVPVPRLHAAPEPPTQALHAAHAEQSVPPIQRVPA